MGNQIQEATIISPSSAKAFSLTKGKSIKITDLEGHQVCDFVIISAKDKREKFDQDRTRVNNWSNAVKKGTTLFSNRNRQLMKVVEDSVGVHDILFSFCSTYIYENMFHVPNRKGCFENISSALSQFGIEPDEIPNPLNIFMNTSIDPNTGGLVLRTAPSNKGDSITLLALEDLLIGASACADDLSECNAGKCKPLKVEIL